MEKPCTVIPTRPARKRFVVFRVAACGILSFVLLNKLFGDFLDYRHYSQSLELEVDRVTVTPLTFGWSKVVPSPDLRWHDCGVRRECARLELPMDHLHPDDDKIAVALVRVPATNQSDYRGPILFNPGGPGGSGVAFIDGIGETFQTLIGPEYDIVGFDPRGIGATTPKVSYFLDDTERAVWGAATPSLINNLSVSLAHSRADVSGQLAVTRAKRAAEYVGTAAVARDMLNITNAFGFDKLKYWGFSYGTVLGGTFAAMFPDHVDRVIIDGVVEFSDYYSGSWYSNLVNTDEILDYISEACVAAGKDCPFYEPTPSQVGSRVRTVLDSLKSHPVPMFNGTSYAVLDYGAVKNVLFQALYSPFQAIEPLFNALAVLEKKGSAEPLLAQVIARKDSIPKCGDTPKSSIVPISLLDGGVAVRCGEGYGVGTSVDSLQRYLEKLGNLSIFADVWFAIRGECSGWEIKAKERYEGNFNETTSFPLLVIGNTLDPVTPLFAAKKASEGFQNSVLLTIDTPGHCSISATSLVALKYVRNYFRDGSLPPVGTVCPIENKLFVRDKSSLSADLLLSKEDRELLELSRDLSWNMHETTKGFYL